MPTVRAKFVCQSKTTSNYGKDAQGNPILLSSVKFGAVTKDSPENEEFFKWTPSGTIELGVLNPAAADALECGKEYFIDFTPVIAAPE